MRMSGGLLKLVRQILFFLSILLLRGLSMDGWMDGGGGFVVVE